MAECFWTDLVGVEQPPCGPVDYGVLVAGGQGATAQRSIVARLAVFPLEAVLAIGCNAGGAYDDISDAIDAGLLPPLVLSYARATRIRSYTWGYGVGYPPIPNACEFAAVNACGGLTNLWYGAPHIAFPVGMDPRFDPAPQLIADVATTDYPLELEQNTSRERDIPYTEFKTPDRSQLIALAVIGEDYDGLFHLVYNVETDLGEVEFVVGTSNCY